MRTILRFLPPFVLWLAPIVIIRMEVFVGHEVLLTLVGAHILGCYWLLYALRNPDRRPDAQGKLTFLRLLVGAPLTAWLLANLAATFAGGVPEADWVGFVGLSALMVWPAILLTLHGVKGPLDADQSRDGQSGPSASNQSLMIAGRYIAPTALWSVSIAVLPFLSMRSPAGPWVSLGCLVAHVVGACWMLYCLWGRRDLLALRILVGLPTTAVFGLGLWQSRTDDTVWMVLPIAALIMLVIWGAYWVTRSPRSAQT